MVRYVGLDAHATSCTFGVINEKGKRLKHEVVETSARSLIDFVTTVIEHRQQPPYDDYLKMLEQGSWPPAGGASGPVSHDRSARSRSGWRGP
jgi:hypothetical protein